jgi:hypothetical protein
MNKRAELFLMAGAKRTGGETRAQVPRGGSVPETHQVCHLPFFVFSLLSLQVLKLLSLQILEGP